MRFEVGHIYHIYNRGNNSGRIFFRRENYLFFLRKVRKEIKPISEILAYCLMPNHFHFMIMATKNSCEENKQGIQVLAKKIGTLLSSYTQAINKERKRTGSLFQQKTKSKDLGELITYPRTRRSYAEVCFAYIHNNPVKARLVRRPEDWEFSSFRELAGLRDGTICNKELAFEILNINEESMYHFSKYIDEDFKNIW